MTDMGKLIAAIKEGVEMNVRMGMEQDTAEKLAIVSLLSDAQEACAQSTRDYIINAVKIIITEGLA